VPVCSSRLQLSSKEELGEHPLLHCEWRKPGPDAPTWQRWADTAGVSGLDWASGVTFTEEAHVIQAAIAGKGVALLSPLHISDELATGALVQPFGPALPGLKYHFVHADTQIQAARCEPLRQWLAMSMAPDNALARVKQRE
jgi:LysR family glycine cleavage system transcriptional activator